MKKLFNLFLSLAMLIIAGMTAESCSKDDDQSVPQNSALAEALEGEWIIEQAIDNIEGYDLDDDEKESLSDGGTQAILYHFYDDGTCWKEIDLMKDNKLVAQLISRYATDASTYTVDASGKVVITLTNIEVDDDESEVLTFDGTQLTTKYADTDLTCTLIRATDAQTQLYKAESDAWYGGNTGDAEGHRLSESVVGEIVGSDGLAYDVADKDNLPEGVTSVAMVAYRNGSRGLAIQLTDTKPEDKTWEEAKNYVKNLAPVPGARWTIATKADWQNMLVACAEEGDASVGDSMAPIFGFIRKVSETGKPILRTWDNYWLNEGPEAPPSNMAFALIGVVFSNMATNLETDTKVCLACLSFNAEGHLLSQSVVGDIVGSDGLAYDWTEKDYLPESVSAAAMVAYKDGTDGLAIALSDEADEMDWNTANGPSGAAAHTPAVAGQTWKLPSLDDFRQMFIGNGGDAQQSWVMNRNLARAGGTALKDNDYYWMSSEWEGDVASQLRHLDNHVGYNRVRKDDVCRVRACFSFSVAKGHALSESANGEVVGSDGLAYAAADRRNLPEGVSAAGMVAYRSGSNGLVIALNDDGSTMNWKTAIGESGASAHTPTVAGYTWRLPTRDEWKQMFSAFGGSEWTYTDLNKAIVNAGGTAFEERDYYWSSTEFSRNSVAYAAGLFSGGVGFVNRWEIRKSRTRACFAF